MTFDIAIINLLNHYNDILSSGNEYVLYINSMFLKLLMYKRRYLYLTIKAGCTNIVADNSLSDYDFMFEKVIDALEEIL